MKYRKECYDVVVCGGGLAGVCAAVASARRGARTCLVQDRPVLGGNSSSECRVTPHGAACHHAYARETGIISEALIEERARNHEVIIENGWTNSIWDLVLQDLVLREPCLTLHLNTAVTAVSMSDGVRYDSAPEPDTAPGYYHRAALSRGARVVSVFGRVANAELELEICGKTFIDATGDGVVADLAGCEWRMGCEGREEFGECHASERANTDTMGNSIMFKTKDVGRPVPFVPPSWALSHDDAAYFYEQGRLPYDLRGGYWWIEIGVPWDTIHQSEEIRQELTRRFLGIWDWIKNKNPGTRDRAAHIALDWYGQVPAKRESRRIMGRYLMTEQDIQARTIFPDEIAFGGWFLDLHTPGGLLAPTSEPSCAEGYRETTDYAVKSYVGPYGIPFRSLVAKDVENLMLAGRNISVSRAALGTVRVMGTTALMGQAAGTAAALALGRKLSIAEFAAEQSGSLQQALLRDGCFLPSARNNDPADFALEAFASASSEALVHGAGPECRGRHDGQTALPRPLDFERDRLKARRGQWIAVGAERMETLSVCLSNRSGCSQSVPAWLMPVDTIWDYRVNTGDALASCTLTVPPGDLMWVDWPVNAVVRPGNYVRLDLGANPDVIWHEAGDVIPGHLAAYEMSHGRMRRYDVGVTLSFRVTPPQASFGPTNVTSGVTRPYRFTNLWQSDPSSPLEQWVQLEWPGARTIRRVEIVFPGHLIHEYHKYLPLFRDSQCARDYRLSAWNGAEWREVLRVTGNYQRQRCHDLATPCEASKVRLVIQATHGDPSAAVYEIRCYG